MRNHYAAERSGTQIMAVLGQVGSRPFICSSRFSLIIIPQHMTLVAVGGSDLVIDGDLRLLEGPLQQFRSSGVCGLMNP